jgi:hypothetical protein
MAAASLLVASQLVSGISQGAAYRAEGDFRKQQSEINSRFAEIEGEAALAKGDKEAAEFEKKVRQTTGTQRAILAAQGIDVDDGTALEIQLEAAEQGAKDAQTIKNNAWRQAFGFRQQSVNELIQGRFDSMTAKYRARSAVFGAGVGGLAQGAAGLSRSGYFDNKKGGV